MDFGEIFGDALKYPFNNIKALLIYIVLGIILGIAVSGTAMGVAAGAAAQNAFAVIASGIVGIVVALFLGFLIAGFQLDIIKYGINRDAGSPGIDPVRQFFNGVKLLIVNIIYYIIPIVISFILGLIFQHWLSTLINIILFVIFTLAAFMGECRLAKTESLGNALAIGEAIGDISKIGILKLIAFIICTFIIAFILYFIVGMVMQANATIGGILLGILGVYISFFIARATGLLYSDV